MIVLRFEVLVECRLDFAFEGRENFLAPERRQEVSSSLSSVPGVCEGIHRSGRAPATEAPFPGAVRRWRRKGCAFAEGKDDHDLLGLDRAAWEPKVAGRWRRRESGAAAA